MSDILTRRVAAAQAAVDAYNGKAMIWGKRDCARLAAFTLKQLGHPIKLAPFGYYKTPATAGLALKRAGFDDLAGVMDSLGFARIAMASALPGDILGFGHADQFLRVSLAVELGNGKMLAFLADQICHVAPFNHGAPAVDYMAWRADPWPL